MKICPLCHTTYEDWIDFCFSDGMPLVAKGGVSSPLPVKASSSGASIAPKLAEGADLPSPGSLNVPEPSARAQGRGEEVVARPPAAEPPSDITGIFTGPVTDDDGEQFRRPPAPQAVNLAALGTGAVPEGAADRSSGPEVEVDAESDEQSRATVPLSSSALGVRELAAEVEADAAAAGPVVESPAPSSEEPTPEGPPSAEPTPTPAEVEPAEPVRPAPVAPTQSAPSVLDSEPPAAGGVGVGLIVGGVLVVGALVLGVLGVGAFFMGKSAPEQPVASAVPAPLPEPKPVPPPAPVAVAPPPVDPAPVDPTLAAPPVAAPPVAAPVVAPVAAAPVVAPVAAAPVKPPPTAPTPVSKPPPATPTSAPASTTADADPWGAPAAVATSGVLKIVTDPDGATVYINEQQRGKTPLTVELAYGVHNIRVVRAGYKTEVRDVTIRVAELNVPFILKPEVVTGQVNVYGPGGYHVFIDGHDRGAMPVTVQVSEGVRQFKLVSDADGTGCSLPKEIAFHSPGRPETVTLACP